MEVTFYVPRYASIFGIAPRISDANSEIYIGQYIDWETLLCGIRERLHEPS